MCTPVSYSHRQEAARTQHGDHQLRGAVHPAVCRNPRIAETVRKALAAARGFLKWKQTQFRDLCWLWVWIKYEKEIKPRREQANPGWLWARSLRQLRRSVSSGAADRGRAMPSSSRGDHRSSRSEGWGSSGAHLTATCWALWEHSEHPVPLNALSKPPSHSW